QAGRLDYFATALSDAVSPLMLDSADPLTFHADASFAQLDVIGVFKATASCYVSSRGPSEIARAREHTFSLIVGLDTSGNIEHRGRVRVSPGDALVLDAQCPTRIDICNAFTGITLLFTESSFRRWVPNPNVLVGRRIDGQSPWGRALCS